MNLQAHLVASRLAGTVATSAGSCMVNCRRLVAGDPDCTFGLSDWEASTYDDAVAALAACGTTFPGGQDPDAPAYVDPSVAAAAVGRQGELLASVAAAKGRVLVATGHPSALLPHYAALARALSAAGCTILEPLGGGADAFRLEDGQAAGIRYFDGVAALVVHGGLVHTHRSRFMEAMLEEAGGPAAVDAVIGDHGFAGAAVEAGINTVSIADVNDPGLPLAQARGRTSGVLVVDDGLDPAVYEPLTAAIVSGFPNQTPGRNRE